MVNFFEHIYIHWPFCAKKCDYCDFLSFVNKDCFMKSYHDALCYQISRQLQDYVYVFKKKPKVKTIFIGGGTPSLYPLDLIKELFGLLRSNLDFSLAKEITIEANPRDVTKDHLKTWQELGINRLSVGVQMLDDKILGKVNRHQSRNDVERLFEIGVKYFNNISVDLILGLPDMTSKKWFETLETVVNFPINHISVYFLTLYKKTPLFKALKGGLLFSVAEQELYSLFEETVKLLETNSFFQYEISNYSKPGFESLHNLSYWNNSSYCGFGLGASSFDGKTRFINKKNLECFIDLANSKAEPFLFIDQKEELSRQQMLLEFIMLGLRQKKGLDLQRVLYFLRSDGKERFFRGLNLLKDLSLLQEKGGRVSLTLKGMMLENEVVLKLI